MTIKWKKILWRSFIGLMIASTATCQLIASKIRTEIQQLKKIDTEVVYIEKTTVSLQERMKSINDLIAAANELHEHGNYEESLVELRKVKGDLVEVIAAARVEKAQIEKCKNELSALPEEDRQAFKFEQMLILLDELIQGMEYLKTGAEERIIAEESVHH